MEDKDILACLWEEVKVRQEHYWSRFNRFALAIITINVVPYVKPELGGQLGLDMVLWLRVSAPADGQKCLR